MKAQWLYWTGQHPNEVPIRDVLTFNDHIEDIMEEHFEMLRNAVAAGVADVVEEIEF